MKETVKSLGGYLMFIGVIGLLGSIAGLFTLFDTANGLEFSDIVGLGYSLWSALALYIGKNLKTLLVKNPQLPFRYCIVNIVLAFLTLSVFRIFFGVVFNGYVIHQLRRLAREETEELEEQVLS